MPLTQIQGQMLSGSNNTTTTIQSNGTTAITIDSSQNVGIGTASPTNKFTTVSTDNVNIVRFAGATYGLTFASFTTGGGFRIEATDPTGLSSYQPLITSGSIQTFLTNNTERMRISPSGDLLIGTTNNAMSAGVGFKFFGNSTTPYCGQVVNTASGMNTYHFYNENATNNGYRFYVGVDGGIRNYSGNNANISDERTKENIEVAGNYLEKICAIPVKTFNYKDESIGEQKTLGVIAQDVEAVAPEFVNNDGWEGTEPEDGIPLKTIYTTDMMFALMKCIQELKAELDATKAEVAELKAKGQ